MARPEPKPCKRFAHRKLGQPPLKNTCRSVKPAKLSSHTLFVNPNSTCTYVGIETECETTVIGSCKPCTSSGKKSKKGKRIGRPKVDAGAARIAVLRKIGRSWSEILRETGLTKGTAQRAFYSLPKKPCGPISARAISIEYTSQPSSDSQLRGTALSVP